MLAHSALPVDLGIASVLPSSEVTVAEDWRYIISATGALYYYHRPTRAVAWVLPQGIDPVLVRPKLVAKHLRERSGEGRMTSPRRRNSQSLGHARDHNVTGVMTNRVSDTKRPDLPAALEAAPVGLESSGSLRGQSHCGQASPRSIGEKAYDGGGAASGRDGAAGHPQTAALPQRHPLQERVPPPSAGRAGAAAWIESPFESSFATAPSDSEAGRSATECGPQPGVDGDRAAAGAVGSVQRRRDATRARLLQPPPAHADSDTSFDDGVRGETDAEAESFVYESDGGLETTALYRRRASSSADAPESAARQAGATAHASKTAAPATPLTLTATAAAAAGGVPANNHTGAGALNVDLYADGAGGEGGGEAGGDFEAPPRVPCPDCGRLFADSHRLAVHVRACRWVFGTRRVAYSAHDVRLRDSPAASLTFVSRNIAPCAACGRRFPTEEDARIHGLRTCGGGGGGIGHGSSGARPHSRATPASASAAAGAAAVAAADESREHQHTHQQQHRHDGKPQQPPPPRGGRGGSSSSGRPAHAATTPATAAAGPSAGQSLGEVSEGLSAGLQRMGPLSFTPEDAEAERLGSSNALSGSGSMRENEPPGRATAAAAATPTPAELRAAMAASVLLRQRMAAAKASGPSVAVTPNPPYAGGSSSVRHSQARRAAEVASSGLRAPDITGSHGDADVEMPRFHAAAADTTPPAVASTHTPEVSPVSAHPEHSAARKAASSRVMPIGQRLASPATPVAPATPPSSSAAGSAGPPSGSLLVDAAPVSAGAAAYLSDAPLAAPLPNDQTMPVGAPAEAELTGTGSVMATSRRRYFRLDASAVFIAAGSNASAANIDPHPLQRCWPTPDEIALYAPVACGSCGAAFRGASALCTHLVECREWAAALAAAVGEATGVSEGPAEAGGGPGTDAALSAGGSVLDEGDEIAGGIAASAFALGPFPASAPPAPMDAPMDSPMGVPLSPIHPLRRSRTPSALTSSAAVARAGGRATLGSSGGAAQRLGHAAGVHSLAAADPGVGDDDDEEAAPSDGGGDGSSVSSVRSATDGDETAAAAALLLGGSGMGEPEEEPWQEGGAPEASSPSDAAPESPHYAAEQATHEPSADVSALLPLRLAPVLLQQQHSPVVCIPQPPQPLAPTAATPQRASRPAPAAPPPSGSPAAAPTLPPPRSQQRAGTGGAASYDLAAAVSALQAGAATPARLFHGAYSNRYEDPEPSLPHASAELAGQGQANGRGSRGGGAAASLSRLTPQRHVAAVAVEGSAGHAASAHVSAARRPQSSPPHATRTLPSLPAPVVVIHSPRPGPGPSPAAAHWHGSSSSVGARSPDAAAFARVAAAMAGGLGGDAGPSVDRTADAPTPGREVTRAFSREPAPILVFAPAAPPAHVVPPRGGSSGAGGGLAVTRRPSSATQRLLATARAVAGASASAAAAASSAADAEPEGPAPASSSLSSHLDFALGRTSSTHHTRLIATPPPRPGTAAARAALVAAAATPSPLADSLAVASPPRGMRGSPPPPSSASRIPVPRSRSAGASAAARQRVEPSHGGSESAAVAAQRGQPAPAPVSAQPQSRQQRAALHAADRPIVSSGRYALPGDDSNDDKDDAARAAYGLGTAATQSVTSVGATARVGAPRSIRGRVSAPRQAPAATATTVALALTGLVKQTAAVAAPPAFVTEQQQQQPWAPPPADARISPAAPSSNLHRAPSPMYPPRPLWPGAVPLPGQALPPAPAAPAPAASIGGLRERLLLGAGVPIGAGTGVPMSPAALAPGSEAALPSTTPLPSSGGWGGRPPPGGSPSTAPLSLAASSGFSGAAAVAEKLRAALLQAAAATSTHALG